MSSKEEAAGATERPCIYIPFTADRLGGQITTCLASIFYAYRYKLPVQFQISFDAWWMQVIHRQQIGGFPPSTSSNTELCGSIFLKSLDEWMVGYNKSLLQTDTDCEDKYSGRPPEGSWYQQMTEALYAIETDFLTYFRTHLYASMRERLLVHADNSNYTIPFDPNRTTLIHLRLDDVAQIAPHDGASCHDTYRECIENDKSPESFELCPWRQAPIDTDVLSVLIGQASDKYPDNEIIFITSPGGDPPLPHRCISSTDENYDMFLLCSAKVIITSKSTFGIVPLLFGVVEEAWVPLWCHNACLGFRTKYDKIDTKKLKIHYY